MKTKVMGVTVALVLMLSGILHAALWDRGGGLIYDDVLDVTWLQDVNFARTTGYNDDGRMNWAQAKDWTSSLIYYDPVRDTNLTNWRLPKALPINGAYYDNDYSFEGLTDYGHNIGAPGSFYEGSTNSELAYMFFTNLGGIGNLDLEGNLQPDRGLDNIDPFVSNLGTSLGSFWTQNLVGTRTAIGFNFYNGFQWQMDTASDSFFAWAVMDGDVNAVPLPGAAWLFASGLISLIILRRKTG